MFRTLRRVLRDGDIDEVRAVSFGGQHPLAAGARPGWYFEPGQHGGTLNDIAIHAFDLIPWLTGVEFARIDAARTWNTYAKAPHFQDGGQALLTLANGAGVLGDVSYFVPDSFGYSLPHYWRVTVWGARGVAETGVNAGAVQVWANGEKEARFVPADPPVSGGYLESFLREMTGGRIEGDLDTAAGLRASRGALLAQRAAEQGAGGVVV